MNWLERILIAFVSACGALALSGYLLAFIQMLETM